MTARLTSVSVRHLRHRTALGLIAVVSCAVIAAGCKDSPTGPSGPPQGFEQTFTGRATAFAFNEHALTAPRAGEMRALLTWNEKGIDLALYLTASSCAAYPPNGGCTILASSQTAVGASETVTRTVASGEQLKLWVDNFSLGSSDYTIEVTID